MCEREREREGERVFVREKERERGRERENEAQNISLYSSLAPQDDAYRSNMAADDVMAMTQ